MSEIDYDSLGLEDIEILVGRGEADLVFTESRGLRLVARIRRLEKALEFYGSEDIYSNIDIDMDGGEIAREALRGAK